MGETGWGEFPIFHPRVPRRTRRLLHRRPSLRAPFDTPPNMVRLTAGLAAFLTLVALMVFGVAIVLGEIVTVPMSAWGIGTPVIVVLWLVTIVIAGIVYAAIIYFDDNDSSPFAFDALTEWRVARQHGRYLSESDFDAPARELAVRAQDAADSVLSSWVHADGLLDGRTNATVLPRELWEIAQDLREHTVRRAEQTGAEPAGADRAEADRLARDVYAVTVRIKKLEAYAAQVADAERTYLAVRRAPGADGAPAVARRAVAGAPATGAPAAGEAALESSLAEAIEAGHALTVT